MTDTGEKEEGSRGKCDVEREEREKGDWRNNIRKNRRHKRDCEVDLRATLKESTNK